VEKENILTPGHTEDSLSVLNAEGNAFAGDITVNMPILSTDRYNSPLRQNQYICPGRETEFKATKKAGERFPCFFLHR
jgi:glyoxylase-like metal-dependent hydrolase (beta-lactamase superfamily II)